jgi:hypothetical protein
MRAYSSKAALGSISNLKKIPEIGVLLTSFFSDLGIYARFTPEFLALIVHFKGPQLRRAAETSIL